MNELTKKQTALDILGISEQRIREVKNPIVRSNLEARQGLPIRSLLSSEVKTFLSKILPLVMDNLGQKEADGAISGIMQSLPSELNRSYFNWTREEIGEAWKLGSLGKLGGGEIHISARNLIQWLEQYDQQHRKPAFKKIRDLRALNNASDTNIPKTEEMTREAKYLALNEALELFRRGELKGYTFYYKLLAELGFCKITSAEETWELVGKANFEILQECKLGANSPFTRDEAKRRIHLIKQIEQPKGETVPDFVQSRIKQIKVREYFESLDKDFVFK